MNAFDAAVVDSRYLDVVGHPNWLSRHAPHLIRKFESTRAAYRLAGLAASPAELDHLVLENFRFVWSYYGQFSQLLLSPRRKVLQRGFEVDGLPALSSSLASGRGAILVTPHLGDFDLAGSWLAQRSGLPVIVVVDTVSPRSRQFFFDSCRRRAGVRIRHVSETRLEDLADDLEHGSLLVLMIDRQVDGPTIEVPFFDRSASISVAPYLLARHCDVPVFAGGATRVANRPAVGHLVPAFDPANEDLEAKEATATLARHLEQLIRRAPAQWHIPTDLDELPWLSDAR